MTNKDTSSDRANNILVKLIVIVLTLWAISTIPLDGQIGERYEDIIKKGNDPMPGK